MVKLIFWGIIGFIVYRYFQMKAQLKEGRKNQAEQKRFHRQNEAADRQKEDGDYIDYEELK